MNISAKVHWKKTPVCPTHRWWRIGLRFDCRVAVKKKERKHLPKDSKTLILVDLHFQMPLQQHTMWINTPLSKYSEMGNLWNANTGMSPCLLWQEHRTCRNWDCFLFICLKVSHSQVSKTIEHTSLLCRGQRSVESLSNFVSEQLKDPLIRVNNLADLDKLEVSAVITFAWNQLWDTIAVLGMVTPHASTQVENPEE